MPGSPDTPQGFVLAQGRPVVVEDYGTESRFVVPEAYRRAGLVSALSVPLSDRGRPVGTLAVRSRQPRGFCRDASASRHPQQEIPDAR